MVSKEKGYYDVRVDLFQYFFLIRHRHPQLQFNCCQVQLNLRCIVKVLFENSIKMGRKDGEYYKQLNFEKKKLPDARGKYKYVAFCKFCRCDVLNTSQARLQQHR